MVSGQSILSFRNTCVPTDSHINNASTTDSNAIDSDSDNSVPASDSEGDEVVIIVPENVLWSNAPLSGNDPILDFQPWKASPRPSASASL